MGWTLDDERAWNRRNPFRTYLGIEVNRVGDGGAEIALPVTETLLQAYGMVHGGIYCVLIDTVLGTCARSALRRDCGPMTIDLNVSFLRPSGLGRLICRGETVKAGRSVVVGVADVLDAEGRKLATGRGSFLLREQDAYRGTG
ncbi:PaaI family thioesterase [Alloalcanivorax gelatiniphagus]|uniref:PaaI family thioesterase n=1 Tax=Alloalcanivorax gelatiniphagus TaxID=1194167 RepID=A0ABY2XQI4_9GAMM|nr:PaaI family thioesterase [Alloalcanivorax gelatiniphagus]TMW13991.1 PaaI family thioesterase [Alloalcanivorax gelatiniphagus]